MKDGAIDRGRLWGKYFSNEHVILETIEVERFLKKTSESKLSEEKSEERAYLLENLLLPKWRLLCEIDY